MTDPLLLPAPFEAAPLTAGVQYSRRYICWTLTEAGTLFRNRYDRASVEITERELWRGEPLWLHAERWATKRSLRQPFTDAGRKALHDLLVPRIARYGFDKVWTRAHGTHQYRSVDDALAAVDAALCEATWWEAVAVLRQLHADHQLAFRPLRKNHPRRQLVAHHRRHASPTHEEVIGEALHRDDHVGWLTREGVIVPDGALLEPPRR